MEHQNIHTKSRHLTKAPFTEFKLMEPEVLNANLFFRKPHHPCRLQHSCLTVIMRGNLKTLVHAVKSVSGTHVVGQSTAGQERDTSHRSPEICLRSCTGPVARSPHPCPACGERERERHCCSSRGQCRGGESKGTQTQTLLDHVLNSRGGKQMCLMCARIKESGR